MANIIPPDSSAANLAQEGWSAVELWQAGVHFAERGIGEWSENIDRSIGFFTEALKALKETDGLVLRGEILYQLAMSYGERVNGEKEENTAAAVACYQGIAEILEDSQDNRGRELFGMALGNLASIYLGRAHDFPEGIEEAIDACQRALTVQTPEFSPQPWCVTQQNLGAAYAQRIEGSRRLNLELAVAAFEAVLKVRTPQTDPAGHQRTMGSLIHARAELSALPPDNSAAGSEDARSQRQSHIMSLVMRAEQLMSDTMALQEPSLDDLQAVIDAYETILDQVDEHRDRRVWGSAQHNIARIYMARRSHATDVARAVTGFETALRVRTQEREPHLWAVTQYCLASALLELDKGNREQNLDRAVQAASSALSYFTSMPSLKADWVKSSTNLGLALLARFQLTSAGNLDDLTRGIQALEAGLSLQQGGINATDPAHIGDWPGVMQAHSALGSAYGDLAVRTLDRYKSNECRALSLHHFRQARSHRDADDSGLARFIDQALATAY